MRRKIPVVSQHELFKACVCCVEATSHSASHIAVWNENDIIYKRLKERLVSQHEALVFAV